MKATYDALSKTYPYLSPDFWGKCNMDTHPFVEFSEFLSVTSNKYESKEPRKRRERRY